MATGSTTNYFLPYPLSTDPVRVAGDIEQLATRIDNILQEEIEDAAAAMWTGGTFSNGLNTPTYNDTTGKMSMSLTQDIQATASPQFVNLTLTGDAEIQGGDITTNQTTFNLINSTTTTLNVGGAATTINVGATNSTSNFLGNINLAENKSFKINNVDILTSTSLASSVISSSLTSVGTVTSGTWSATEIAVNRGGTGLTSLPTNGQLLIGNGAGYTLSTITAGSGIIVTNSSGSITIAAETGGDVFPSQTGNAGKFLTTNGTAPSWDFVPQSSVTNLTTDLSAKAPIAGPTFTGTVKTEGTEIIFNSDEDGSPTNNILLSVERGTEPKVSIRWEENLDVWQVTNDGTNYIEIGSSGGLENTFLLMGS
jgi:hypothetical protein